MTKSKFQTKPFQQDAWRGALRDLSAEHGYRPLELEGQVPADLRGTLYRAGPALFSSQGRPYGHLFDGDGAISAVRVGPDGVFGAVRLVETPGLVRERAAKRPLYGGWGTSVPGLMRGFQKDAKNPANTTAWVRGDQLFALFEGGRPTEIARDSLATLGERDFSTQIRAAFSAHPRYAPQLRSWFNFGARYGIESGFDLYAWPDSGALHRFGHLPTPGVVLAHDFVVAGDWLLFLIPPLRINLYTAAFGRRPMQESFSYKPSRGLLVAAVSLADPAHPIWIETEACFLWHLVNAWQEADRLFVDAVTYPDLATNAWFGGLLSQLANLPAEARLERFEIDLVRRHVSRYLLLADSCEFPRIAPADDTNEHRYVYLAAHSSREAARGLWDRLLRFDASTGRTEDYVLEGGYPSEGLFIPITEGETKRGYLLGYVYAPDRNRTGLYIWRAEEPGAPPLCKAWFDFPLPITFHGSWQSHK